MPRAKKQRTQPRERPQSRWYHYVPSVLWKMGSAAAGAAIAKKHGAAAGAAFGAGLAAVEPNRDFWFRHPAEYGYERDLPPSQEHDFPSYQEWQQAEFQHRSIPDIDDVSSEFYWVPNEHERAMHDLEYWHDPYSNLPFDE